MTSFHAINYVENISIQLPNQLVQLCWAHSVKAMYIQIMKSVFVAYFYIIDDDNLREN